MVRKFPKFSRFSMIIFKKVPFPKFSRFSLNCTNPDVKLEYHGKIQIQGQPEFFRIF